MHVCLFRDGDAYQQIMLQEKLGCLLNLREKEALRPSIDVGERSMCAIIGRKSSQGARMSTATWEHIHCHSRKRKTEAEIEGDHVYR